MIKARTEPGVLASTPLAHGEMNALAGIATDVGHVTDALDALWPSLVELSSPGSTHRPLRIGGGDHPERRWAPQPARRTAAYLRGVASTSHLDLDQPRAQAGAPSTDDVERRT